MKTLLIEIEPEIEKTGGKMDIIQDKEFGIKYSNLVLILKTIEKYLLKSQDKTKFKLKIDIMKMIKINDLLKHDKIQLINMVELIILVSSISSRKDHWLEKISECDEKLLNLYLTHVEKYIPLDNRNDESLTNASFIKYSNLEGQSKILGVLNDKLNKKIEEFEREKAAFMKTINDKEDEISKLKGEISKSHKDISDERLNMEYLKKELEHYKESAKKAYKASDDLAGDTFQLAQLRSEVQSRDQLLEHRIKEIEQIRKQHSDEVEKFKDKIDQLEEKVQVGKNMAVDNEKLRHKIKELQFYKEKQGQFDELVLSLESKSRMIDSLIKEKQGLLKQLEEINKDKINEREKGRQLEKNIKELSERYETLLKDYHQVIDSGKFNEDKGVSALNQNNNLSEFNKQSSQKEDPNTTNKNQIKLQDIETSLIQDLDKTTNERLRYIEKEILDLKAEKAELMKKYKNELSQSTKNSEERAKLQNQIDTLTQEVKRFKAERDKADFEKEKMDLKNQKSEVETQKKILLIEKLEIEKKKLEDDFKSIQEKHTKLLNEKNALKKESDKLVEKLTKEKASLTAEVSNFTKEIDKIKQGYEAQCNSTCLFSE